MNSAHRLSFLMHCSRLGLNDYNARRMARYATTHHRLAEAECNGDYPCDNGQRKVEWCTRCGAGYVRSHVIKGLCDMCRVEDRIKALAAECGVNVELQGDPRVWTVTLSK